MKKALSILLSLLMAFSVFGGLSLPTAHAAGTGKALQLMPNGAAANLTGAQTSSVWFGRYKNTGSKRTGSEVRPLKWRVLSNANGKLFLITDQNIDMVPYNSENVDVT
ncbi:MAG: hypothetical protein IJK23_10385 [Clostridia bacterium]|nr:hypothetical protein [Clostridia bacterium]